MKADGGRRIFLKQTALGAGALCLGVPLREQSASASGVAEDDLFERFQTPPAEARPFFRWWWNGNRVTEGELRRELRVMHEAGAGGVEINPIALHETVERPTGEALDWLGDAWGRTVEVAVEESQKLGMVVDLIVGTGWPFGGDFLAPEETIRGLEWEATSVEGPATFEQTLPVDGAGRRLVQLALYPEPVGSLGAGVDLTDRVGPDGRVAVEVPPGPHRLYAVVERRRFRDVMFGAPGGDGPVLDHFNRGAVEAYLERTSEVLAAALGGRPGEKGIRAFFCDSIELEGANWTSDLPAEFERRRGYALGPHLPLVLDTDVQTHADVAEAVGRIRYDLARTLAELFEERFIRPFHAWCHANGTLSRYQAYGYPWLYTDPLDGYLIPDIPEGDQWLFNAGWVKQAPLDEIRYAIWNKYASSAGHLKGRRIISSEAMTNTKGVFRAAPAYLKQATDIDVVTGINHLVLHGFNYSPPEAGVPGWVRFGTYFGEHNPWWPYVRAWMDYAARLSAVFQASEPTAQVALLGPTADVWSEHGLDRNAWNTTPPYLHALWQALNHHGYLADYVNATILQGATFEGGTFRYGPMRYEVLIVAGAERLEPTTAQALRRFAEAGGRIVFVGGVPRRAPGWLDQEASDADVQEALADLPSRYPERVRTVAEPGEPYPIAWAGETMRSTGVRPDVRLAQPDPKLYFTRHRAGERDVFFFVNMDRERTLPLDARLPTSEKTPWRWDPETGERAVFPTGADHNRIEAELAPLESLLLVCEPGQAAPPPPTSVVASEDPFARVTGPWSVTFAPVVGAPYEATLPALVDLGQSADHDTFAGTATYRTPFRLDDPLSAAVLDLGDVREVAEVTLNGTPLGVRWWGRRRYDVGGLLRKGENVLEVRVATLLYNYVRSLQDDPHARYWMEQGGDAPPLPSGLIGPVRLYRAAPSE